mgnify:FL=1
MFFYCCTYADASAVKPHRIFEPGYPPANAGSMRRKIYPRASGQRYQIPHNCSAHGHRNPYDSHRKPKLVPLSGQTAHGLTPLRWYCHFAVSATPDNLSRHMPPPDKCGAFFVFPSSPLQKHPPDQNRCHQIGDQNSIAHIVLLSINERLHLCPPLAAAVASGFHRHGKVICTPKRSDKQRH